MSGAVASIRRTKDGREQVPSPSPAQGSQGDFVLVVESSTKILRQEDDLSLPSKAKDTYPPSEHNVKDKKKKRAHKTASNSMPDNEKSSKSRAKRDNLFDEVDVKVKNKKKASKKLANTASDKGKNTSSGLIQHEDDRTLTSQSQNARPSNYEMNVKDKTKKRRHKKRTNHQSDNDLNTSSETFKHDDELTSTSQNHFSNRANLVDGKVKKKKKTHAKHNTSASDTENRRSSGTIWQEDELFSKSQDQKLTLANRINLKVKETNASIKEDNRHEVDEARKRADPHSPGWREREQARDHDGSSCYSSDNNRVEEASLCPGAVAIDRVSSYVPYNEIEEGIQSLVPSPALISAVLVEDEDGNRVKVPVVEARPIKQLLYRQIFTGIIVLVVVIASVVSAIVVTSIDKNHDEDDKGVTFQPIVTVALQLDEAPTETGWQLHCDGRSIANRSVGSYTSTFQLDRQRFNVSEGAICTFSIQDAGGDGLCCEHGFGHYKVHVGADISDDMSIRMEGSSFGDDETATFYVTEPWQEIGAIAGENIDSYSGFAVALSADGMIMAIGSTGLVSFELGATGLGYLQIMRFDLETKEWSQLGSTLETGSPGDYFGFSVALSSDGTIVAVGAPFSDMMEGLVRVFQYNANSNEWMQLGQDLKSGTVLSVFGLSLTLSGDGSLLAVGAPSDGGLVETTGFARVFRFAENEWKQIGEDIFGDEIGDHFGWSMSFSGDGNLLAFGTMVPFSDRMGGYVRLYTIAENRMFWERQMEDILFEHGNDDWFGYSVDLSFDGSILAVGAPGYFNILRAGEGELNSYVQVYEKQGTSGWTKKGQELQAEKDGDNFGISVSLSWAGDIIAVGAPFNDRTATSAGMVASYKFDNSTSKWVLTGQPILGVDAEALTGWSVALSKDARYLAVSSPRENANDIFQSGQTRLYGQ